MANKTVTQLDAAVGAAPASLELIGYNAADAGMKTRKWTLSTLLAALTAPNFTTARVASGATVSALLGFSGTVAVTSLAAGAQADINIAAVGVLANDHIVVTPRSAPAAGLTYMAWVSAADQITVRVTNTSGLGATGSIAVSLLAVRTA